ncbi:MAG: hypothetical protein C4291_10145 [Candidatus Dadabacteria bacterium]
MAGATDEYIPVFQGIHIYTSASSAGSGRGERIPFFRLKVSYFQISSGYVCGEFKSRITRIAYVIETALRFACVCYIPRAANRAGDLDR